MSRFNTIVLVLTGLVLLAIPLFVGQYMTQIAITTITYSMLGLVFAFGMRVGLPRLDLAAWWGVGGFTTALLMKMGFSFWITLIAGGMVAVIAGWLLFSLALPRGTIAFFTFGMVLSMTIYQVFGSVEIFGGWGGLTGIPAPDIGPFKFDTLPKVYYLGLFFLTIMILVYYLLYHSRTGRAWNAISSSLRLARSIGIDIVQYRMANVLIGNFFIALAGSYFVSYYSAAIPSMFSFQAGVNTIVFLIIGGFGHSIIGPIIGAVIASFIPEYLHFANEYQSIASSAIVILILIFLPMGIIGVFDSYVKPWLKRQKWYIAINNSGQKSRTLGQ